MHFVQLSREIEIHLTIERAARLRDRGLFDVMDMPGNASQFSEVIADPVRFFRVLWEMTDQAGMTFEQFARGLQEIDGQELIDVFLGELFGFFRDLTTSVVEGIAKDANSRLKSLCQNAALNSIGSDSNEPGSPSTNSPESVESILRNSHFASSTTWPGDDSRPNGSEQVP